ncbi:AAEL001597-PA [Aedes aegypti]|uniref:AAEL001597-PA n=1 Tax=Aedes aegypti TaxID=7159 RepID=Q17KQ0_AEDAE|nr:AAEL001597-PA [Aedes aegypti]
MNNVIHSDDEVVLEQSFARNTQPVIQNGYAEGLADGRETIYQKDFDRGYRIGFTMAFKLAQYQGFAAGLQKQSDKEELARNIAQDLILRQESARAHCLLCSDKTMGQNLLDDVEASQNSHNEGILKVLEERYKIS